MSTDRLGRHPGRPWPTVRAHVAEHYLKLSAAAIYEFLLTHHENLWPRIRDAADRLGLRCIDASCAGELDAFLAACRAAAGRGHCSGA